MEQNRIGKLKEVELRKIWKNEPRDFSKWIVENGLNQLSNILGLTLIEPHTEESIGSFSCDIVCKDEMSDRVVIIENQLEQSNHDHLGKCLTYAAGRDASVIVWIVKKAREEHAKAIEWLNQHSDTKISFYLLEIHGLQIDDSAPAPQFRIIEQPNNSSVIFKKNVEVGPKTLATWKNRFEFWNKFNDFLSTNYPALSRRKATDDNWYDFSIGSSKCQISVELVNKYNQIHVGIYIPNCKEQYDIFFKNKSDIENVVGETISWERLDNKKASRFYSIIPGFSFENKDNHDNLMKKIIDLVLKYKKSTKPFLYRR